MLEIYSPTGQLLVGSGTSVGTILGQFMTGTTSGSITNPNLSNGSPIIFYALPTASTSWYTLPTFTFSGNTLSWSFTNGTGINCRVIYGVK